MQSYWVDKSYIGTDEKCTRGNASAAMQVRNAGGEPQVVTQPTWL